MQILCSKSELIRGIQTVQSAVSTKNTLPVLANILLETQSNQLKLAATDLEVGVRCMVKAEVVKEGALTVPAKTLSDFIRTLPEDQEIRIQSEDSARMEIRSGKTKCVLLGLPKEDFPVLPDFPEETAVLLESKVLKEMIHRTVYAMSTDETRYILNGIFFMLEKGQMRAVATDGRRLAYMAREIADKKASFRVIVPAKAVRELERLLGGEGAASDTIAMSVTANQVAFRAGDTIIISRIIEGNFPNYEQVIPKSSTIRLQVATKDFLMMTQRASLGSGERGGAVKFAVEKNKLRAIGSAQGRVEVEDEMMIDYAGTPLEIAFNPQFVIDILKSMDGGSVALEFSTALNPGVIRPVGDEQTISVIMPMRA